MLRITFDQMNLIKGDTLQPPRQFRVAGHLAAAVAGHRPAHHGGQTLHLAGEALQRSYSGLPSI